MVSLIESLINAPVKRQDQARLTIPQRPAPNRTRQLFELFITMGPSASFQGLHRSIDFKTLDPQTMVFTVLGRWPTKEEAALFEDPYKPWPHMQALLRSHEFRYRIARRTAEAFPERRRLLFVRIPSSAGRRVLATINSKHPILPNDLNDRRYNEPAVMAKCLGTMFGRMNISNAVAMIGPAMAPFFEEPENTPADQDPLAWHVPSVPCRTGDLLFAMIRDPVDRALAFVNQAVADFQGGRAPLPEPVHAAYAHLSEQDRATLPVEDRQAIARALLQAALLRNPICQALGDGTAKDTVQSCRCAPVHLVPPSAFSIWGRTALDVIPPDPPPPPETILRQEDLTQADRDAIAAATAEDRVFYTLFKERHASLGLPAILGREL
jgi:hypothetical protein